MSEFDTSVIPKGIYCYDQHGRCPYWSKNPDKDDQESGYCAFLQCGDWENRLTWLLWDQVKECGINNDLMSDEL